MKIKVSETTPLQLDWLVAKCLFGKRLVHYRTWLETENAYWKGQDCTWAAQSEFRILSEDFDKVTTAFVKTYTTDPAQGQPILEREYITTKIGEWDQDAEPNSVQSWCARSGIDEMQDNDNWHYGPTMLIAGLRCFVASKLGDEVEVPDDRT